MKLTWKYTISIIFEINNIKVFVGHVALLICQKINCHPLMPGVQVTPYTMLLSLCKSVKIVETLDVTAHVCFILVMCAHVKAWMLQRLICNLWHIQWLQLPVHIAYMFISFYCMVIMPRSKDTEFTGTHARQQKFDVPWLNEFLERCVRTDVDSFSTKSDVYYAYQRFLHSKKPSDHINRLSLSQNRFSRTLLRWMRHPANKGHGIEEKNWNLEKGYNVSLKQITRGHSKRSTVSVQAMADYVRTPLEQRPVLVKSLFVSRKIGKGAFAKDFIPAETIITEYFGTRITKAIADEREKEYKKLGLLPAMFYLPTKEALDPHDEKCPVKLENNRGEWVSGLFQTQ